MLRRIREVKDDQSGFTLIELLIVIVILGILAAVVVFAVGAFNKNGLQAACQSDFKSVEIADESYYAQHTSTYALASTDLVPNYIKEWPSTTAPYKINLTSTGVSVSIPAIADTNGLNGIYTTTAARACAKLSR